MESHEAEKALEKILEALPEEILRENGWDFCDDCDRGVCSDCDERLTEEHGYCPDCDRRDCDGCSYVDPDDVDDRYDEGWNDAIEELVMIYNLPMLRERRR